MIKDFLRSFTAYFAVLPLFSTLGLWRYVVLTGIISLILAIVIIALGIAAFAAIPQSWIPGTGVWDTVGQILAALVVIAIGLLSYKHIVLIVTAPWIGIVAHRVLEHRGVEVINNFSNAQLIWRSLRFNLRLFAQELVLSVPILLLGLIPGINVVATILLFAIQAFFVGAGALDYSLEGRYDLAESRAFIRRNRGLSLGAGTGFVLLLLTAVGFLFAPTWSVAAGAWTMGGEFRDQSRVD